STDVLSVMPAHILVLQTSSPALADVLRYATTTGYISFNPTADSLHGGSLLQLMILKRFQLAGHRPVAVVGGGTGLIGDPSGKSDERCMLTRDVLDRNVAGIRAQIEKFIEFGPDRAILVDYSEWLAKLSLIDFLRD